MEIDKRGMCFFKKLWERIKRLFARKQRPVPLLLVTEEPIENMNQLIKSLIHVESMLCQSACVAEDRYPNDAEHLMKIIRNQHVGVESVLKRMGVECKRSQDGDEFTPEYMEASENFVLTNDKTKDEKVAVSEAPGFWKDDKVLTFEKVKLYNYQA